ncbi:MAG: DUF2294 domain-containing protein [Pegethrix bostrychoides GSE-TBD4-15B]|jgi:uncharacterized protein YbcI|uniref:DUF2294 domain-containing protein n=1 Tax=Pegethrix bostrychoides GSE-TBD4-15B TaxID=2839662 RepID=A0A951PBV1_9CYAN|nr:DUF2294 domain-containing protein [Pegethrix bostrychoides GSE-TBD4-15B]
MSFQILTRGQLERTLSQNIQALYRNLLGHQTGKVTCQLVDEKLTIVIENSATQPEKLLANEGQVSLAEQLCTCLNSAIRPQIKLLIEQVLSVNVLDLLGEATLVTDRTGLIAILDAIPKMRISAESQRMPKQKLSQSEPSSEPSHELT